MKDYLEPIDKLSWKSRKCLITERTSRFPAYFKKDIDGYLLNLAIVVLNKYSTVRVLIHLFDSVEFESYLYLEYSDAVGMSKTSFRRGLTELILSGIVRKINSSDIYQIMPAYVWWGYYEKKEQAIRDWIIERNEE